MVACDQCLLLAQSRHAQCADECQAKRTLTNRCSPLGSRIGSSTGFGFFLASAPTMLTASAIAVTQTNLTEDDTARWANFFASPVAYAYTPHLIAHGDGFTSSRVLKPLQHPRTKLCYTFQGH